MQRNCARPAGKLMILFLVKFLNKEAHVRDLLDGRIYANRLSWFKRTEAEDASGRLDRHEGVVAWHQPDRISNLVINGWNLTPDLAGPVEMHGDWLNHLNIYCTYAGCLPKVELEQLPDDIPPEVRSQLAIPEACFSLGQYAVVINNVTEFIRRVGEAVTVNQYRMRGQRVKYYNPDTYHGSHFNIDALFQNRIATVTRANTDS